MSTDRYDGVLDAAESCYDRNGWANATMEEVAGVAGVSRAYIYKHFQNKDGLMLAILVRRAHHFNQRARKFIAAQPNLEEALVEGILLGVKLAHRDHYFGRLVGAATSDPDNPVTGAMAAARQATDELWRPVLTDAAASGELRDGVDIDDIIDWINIVLLGLLANRKSLRADDGLQERQLRTLLVPALTGVNTTRQRAGRR